MKRSLQEVVELVVFGLVALLVGTALVWVLGWVLSLGGALFKALAGLLWLLLRFIVPIAIVAGLVYFLVKALQGRGAETAGAGTAGSGAAGTGTGASGAGVQGAVEKVKEAAGDVVAKAKDVATEVGDSVSKAVGKTADDVSGEVSAEAEAAAAALDQTVSDADAAAAETLDAASDAMADSSADDESRADDDKA